MNLNSLEGRAVIFRADIKSIYLNKSASSYKYPDRWVADITNLRCNGKVVKTNGHRISLDVTKHYQYLLEGDTIKFKTRVSLDSDNRFKNIKNIELLKSPLVDKVGKDHLNILSEVCINVSTRVSGDKVNQKINKEDVIPFIVKSNRENGSLFTFNYLLENIKSIGYGYKKLYKEILLKCSPDMYFVYQLKRGSDIVYIGSSKGLGSRLSNHKRDKDFDEVLICLCKDKEDMLILENGKIQEIQPEYNKSINLNLARLYKEDPNHIFESLADHSLNFIPTIPMHKELGFNNEGYYYEVKLGLFIKEDLYLLSNI